MQALRGLKQTLIVEYIFMLMLDQNIIHFLLRCTQLVSTFSVNRPH